MFNTVSQLQSSLLITQHESVSPLLPHSPGFVSRKLSCHFDQIKWFLKRRDIQIASGLIIKSCWFTSRTWINHLGEFWKIYVIALKQLGIIISTCCVRGTRSEYIFPTKHALVFLFSFKYRENDDSFSPWNVFGCLVTCVRVTTSISAAANIREQRNARAWSFGYADLGKLWAGRWHDKIAWNTLPHSVVKDISRGRNGLKRASPTGMSFERL